MTPEDCRCCTEDTGAAAEARSDTDHTDHRRIQKGDEADLGDRIVIHYLCSSSATAKNDQGIILISYQILLHIYVPLISCPS